MNKRNLIAAILLIVVFLAGFVPQYLKVKKLENDLSAVRRENALAQLRDLAGLSLVQTSQKNYGLAAGTIQRYFTSVREAASQSQLPSGRKALEELLLPQDKILTELTKGDPAALNDLQLVFEKTRQATSAVDR